MAPARLKFPSDALVPRGGEMYGHIFENRVTGLVRNLFWSITIDFEPVQYGGDEFTCSMTCEWIPWPIRDWRELNGKHLQAEYGQDGIESSFYMTEHDLGTRTELVLRHRHENVFTSKMDMVVDFHGFHEGDENPAMSVHAECDVAFIGLLITPENLFPKPLTPPELRNVASEFVDLSTYHEPERWRAHNVILRPVAA